MTVTGRPRAVCSPNGLGGRARRDEPGVEDTQGPRKAPWQGTRPPGQPQPWQPRKDEATPCAGALCSPAPREALRSRFLCVSSTARENVTSVRNAMTFRPAPGCARERGAPSAGPGGVLLPTLFLPAQLRDAPAISHAPELTHTQAAALHPGGSWQL